MLNYCTMLNYYCTTQAKEEFHMSSGWFVHTKPVRTTVRGDSISLNLLEPLHCRETRHIEPFHMSSEWFDATELSLTNHLVPPVKVPLVKVRYSRTAPNSCERILYTLFSLQWSGSRSLMISNLPELVYKVPYAPCSPCEGVVREGSV